MKIKKKLIKKTKKINGSKKKHRLRTNLKILKTTSEIVYLINYQSSMIKK
jgi:hypothetical protein